MIFTHSDCVGVLSFAGGTFGRAERIVKSGDDCNRSWRIPCPARRGNRR